MALKGYNNNTPHQKVLIGNWAEERAWADTAEQGEVFVPTTRLTLLDCTISEISSFWRKMVGIPPNLSQASIGYVPLCSTQRFNAPQEEWNPRSTAQATYVRPREPELPTRAVRTELKTREMWQRALYVFCLLKYVSIRLTRLRLRRETPPEAAPKMDLNTTYKATIAAPSATTKVCTSFCLLR